MRIETASNNLSLLFIVKIQTPLLDVEKFEGVALDGNDKTCVVGVHYYCSSAREVTSFICYKCP